MDTPLAPPSPTRTFASMAFYGIFATEEAARKYGGYRSDQSDFDSFYNKYNLEREYESSVADPDASSSEVDDKVI